jgi:shikimate dehydrogenase
MGTPYAEVIGDPIAHSKSPLIHRFWLERLRIEGDYRAVRVTPGELASYFASRRSDADWRGCNVTVPHKETVLSCLDDVEDCSIGAVNCVVPRDGRLVGLNTDAGGLNQAWTFGVDTDAPVCIIGAGGAARAAFASLDVLTVYRFHLIARDRTKALSLLAPHGDYARHFDFDHAAEALVGCVGVINATPLGMDGFAPMPASVLNGLVGLRHGGFAVDLVYSPLETAFLAKARREGLQAVDGLTVLIGQAYYAFFQFFGAPPLRQEESALRELLTS